MSKKKHPEHVNHERWLVSYADFITLLFAFFVVLFASGQADKKKQTKMSLAMQTAFEHNGIFEPHSKTPPLAEDASSAAVATPMPIALPLPTPEAMTAAKATEERIAQVIRQEVAKRQGSAASVTIRPAPEGLVVSLREAGFFASGSADVRPEALETLRAVASALPHQPMRVEGHTDNVPIHTPQFATNWELSTARAASITRLLLSEQATDPASISAAGYAEFRPTAPNDSEANRSQNRRVDIVLLKPVPQTRPAQSSAAPSPPRPPAPSQ